MFSPLSVAGLAATLALLSLSGCAVGGSYGEEPGYRYAGDAAPVYSGGNYGAYGIGGEGADHLDPWLSGTMPGQYLVLAHFDHNYNRRIGLDRAGEANRWFRRFADRNHDLRLTDDEINRGLAALDRKLRQRRY